ncbi:MAG: hypothetical protein LBV19_01210 [Streptococcaceae bacterium]|nr:hypothetical protein [Streptococcaceae bacterium]
MKAWGWGFISIAAFLLMIWGFKSWQFILLVLIVGIIMIVRGGKETPKDGDSKDDKSVK